MTPEQIEILSQLTIVIPSCNRPLKLERAIEYWRDLPVTVHIVDGSEKPWFSVGVLQVAKNINYHHMPPKSNEHWMENYAKRLKFASGLPTTKFSALCGDDDFFSISGLKIVLESLSRDKGIDAVVGICAEYKNSNSEILWHLRYTDWREGLKSRSDDSAERILDQSGAFYLYYAIIRSEIWKKILFLTFKNSYEHNHAVEHLFNSIALAHCRAAVERHITWNKETWTLNENIPGQVSRISDADWFRSRKNRHEVRLITEHLAMGFASSNSYSSASARFVAKKYIRRVSKISETAKFRKIKKQILQKIVSSLNFLPNTAKSIFNRILPRQIRLFTGVEEQIVVRHLTKNNYFSSDSLLVKLSSTDIGFDGDDFKIIENLLLMPREELRLRANI